MRQVCFFGAYDPGYPRHRILRDGLVQAGHQVVEARAPQWRAFRRWPALAAAFGRVGLGADTLLVPEFRQKDVPLARLLAGSRRLIFDPLVSRLDTLVDDWGLHARGSAQAHWNERIDRMSLAASDVVLCDTWAHGRLYAGLGARWDRLRRVPVGAEAAFFAVPPRAEDGVVRLLYLGGFLPIHGARFLLEALALLERRPGLPPFHAVLAGSGIEFESMRARARELGLERVAFPGRVDYGEAPGLFAGADIVLGAFGPGAKAGRVVPHKVYQGLAAGRAVVTGDGEGLREFFQPGLHLEAPARGEPAAIALALERLVVNRARREEVAAAGRARVLEFATPELVGRTLADVIEESW